MTDTRDYLNMASQELDTEGASMALVQACALTGILSAIVGQLDADEQIAKLHERYDSADSVIAEYLAVTDTLKVMQGNGVTKVDINEVIGRLEQAYRSTDG